MEYIWQQKEVLIHATTCIKIENIKLNDRSPLQKATYFRIPFTQMSE